VVRWLILVAAGTTACRFGLPDPAQQGDGPTGGDDADIKIDAPRPDAPPQPGDRDGDGILDAADKCPDVFDPLQRDHDNDGFGDACDGCPPFASATNDDTDGDGVGDSCDPHPATPGDKIAVWFGFFDEDATTVLGFAKGGTWTVSNSALHTDNNGSSSSFLRAPPAINRAIQFAHVVLDDFSSSSAAAALENGELLSGGNVTQLYQCALFRSTGELRAKSIVADNVLDDQGVAWTGATSNGTALDMTAQFTNAFRCTATPPSTQITATDGTLAGQVELFAQRADLSFDYWFVIDAAP